MRLLNNLLLVGCFALTLSLLPGCGGSNEVTVTAPPETADPAPVTDEKKEAQLENDQRKNGGPLPGTGSPADL